MAYSRRFNGFQGFLCGRQAGTIIAPDHGTIGESMYRQIPTDHFESLEKWHGKEVKKWDALEEERGDQKRQEFKREKNRGRNSGKEIREKN